MMILSLKAMQEEKPFAINLPVRYIPVTTTSFDLVILAKRILTSSEILEHSAFKESYDKYGAKIIEHTSPVLLRLHTL